MTKTIINEECLSMLSENGKQTKSINHKITINTITPTALVRRVGELTTLTMNNNNNNQVKYVCQAAVCVHILARANHYKLFVLIVMNACSCSFSQLISSNSPRQSIVCAKRGVNNGKNSQQKKATNIVEKHTHTLKRTL